MGSIKQEENKFKNKFKKLSNGYKGGKHINQINKGIYNSGVQQSKSLTGNPF